MKIRVRMGRLKKLQIIIFCVILCGSIFSQDLSLLKKGIVLRDNGKFYEALNVLKKAEKLDKENPEILYNLALTHSRIGIQKNDVNHRLLASEMFEEAIKIDPHNEKYLFEYAKLKNAQGYKWNAEKIMKKLLEVSPENDNVYLELAKLYARDGLWLKNMKSTNRVGSAGHIVEIDMAGFYENQIETAKELFRKGLEYNPENPELYYHLGILYLEENNLEKMEQLFKKAVELDKKFKNAYLILGYTYYRKKEYENAYDAFEKAKNLMNDEEYSLFMSFDRIFNEKSEIFDKYWASRNPSFLNNANLRELEHYSRVAYANLMFGNPEENIPGWTTERGHVYIRYGKPLAVRKEAAGFDPNNRLKPTKEFWIYRDFSFLFEDTYMSRVFRLYDAEWNSNKYWQLSKEKPDIFNEPYKLIRIDIPYYTAAFKGEKNKIDFEIYCSIPVYKIPKSRIENRQNFVFEQGVFLFDDNWEEIKKSIDLKNVPVSDSLKSLNSSLILKVIPGKFNVAIEFKEKADAFFGQKKFSLEIIPEEKSLYVSDIILGLEGKRSLLVNSRAGINNIVPIPDLSFDEDVIGTYFEIYNLNFKNGKTNFTVDISVSEKKKKEKSVLGKFAKKLINIFRKSKEGIITHSYNYSGKTPDEKIPLKLDISKLKSGDYILGIKVKDNNSSEKAGNERQFNKK